MTDPLWEHGDGQTVLHPDDRVGLVASLGGPELTWGAGYPDIEQARSVYIAALRAADAGDPDPLIAFVTS